MTAAPLVSVVLTSYNYAPFVGAAIESVLDQTYDPIELVVVDDGSTDGSRDVIASFGGRLQVALTDHRGFAAALNAGSARTRGDIVCFLDADDRFVPDKVERVVALFESAPEAGACFHARVLEAPGGERRAIALGASGLLDARHALRQGRPPFISTTTSALAFRRDVLERVLPLPESDGIGVSDHALKFGALALAPVLLVEEVLAVQLTHERNSYTGTHSYDQAADVLLRNARWIEGKFPDMGRLVDRLVLEAAALPGGRTELHQDLLRELIRRKRGIERARLKGRVAVVVARKQLQQTRPGQR